MEEESRLWVEDDLQEPRRAFIRRDTCGSEISALPRYERHGEDAKCAVDMEMEKRGKYTYVLDKPLVNSNGSVNWKERHDEDAVTTSEDTLPPVYHSL